MALQDDGNPAEVESLRDGDYVAVRRFVRILERGDDAKGVLDAVVDQCGSLINLRTAIMRYRKPKRWFTFYRCSHCHTMVNINNRTVIQSAISRDPVAEVSAKVLMQMKTKQIK